MSTERLTISDAAYWRFIRGIAQVARRVASEEVESRQKEALTKQLQESVRAECGDPRRERTGGG